VRPANHDAGYEFGRPRLSHETEDDVILLVASLVQDFAHDQLMAMEGREPLFQRLRRRTELHVKKGVFQFRSLRLVGQAHVLRRPGSPFGSQQQ
jgi:hypothetical protein